MSTLSSAGRIVVKVGTSTLTHPSGLMNIRRVEALVKVLSDLKNSGKQIILVSSGAIGVGVGKLSLDSKPADMPTKQACAAVGQCELMYVYDKLFSEYNHRVAQVLLTRDVIEQDSRRENVINTFERLLQLGVIPIVNENDTVSTEEIEFGDNDTLSAIVSELVSAKLLILLSDIDGLYDSDPKQNPDARLIPFVDSIDKELQAAAGGKGSTLGTGGMTTKLQAGKICLAANINMIIANGENPRLLYDLMDGKQVGTLFSSR